MDKNPYFFYSLVGTCAFFNAMLLAVHGTLQYCWYGEQECVFIRSMYDCTDDYFENNSYICH